MYLLNRTQKIVTILQYFGLDFSCMEKPDFGSDYYVYLWLYFVTTLLRNNVLLYRLESTPRAVI